MHIFSGQRFRYNPFEGGVSGAYFGKSEKGNHRTLSWVSSLSLDSHFILCKAPIWPSCHFTLRRSLNLCQYWDIETMQGKGGILYCQPRTFITHHIHVAIGCGLLWPPEAGLEKGCHELCCGTSVSERHLQLLRKAGKILLRFLQL